MKKLLLISFVSLLFINSYAGNANLFNYDESAVENEFQQLNALENYVSSYNITLNELKANNSILLTQLHLNGIETARPLGMMFGIDDMDWGSFAWGFCCWPVGIFTVLLKDDKDSNSKTSYFVGIGTFIVFGLVSRIAL